MSAPSPMPATGMDTRSACVCNCVYPLCDLCKQDSLPLSTLKLLEATMVINWVRIGHVANLYIYDNAGVHYGMYVMW